MSKCLRSSNFREGIRAVLVDKDNKPIWTPSTLHDVTAQDIEQYFKSPQEFELNLEFM